MYCKRFDSILSSLHFTNREVTYEDGLFHILQSEGAWNQNMDQQFLPWWINILDESMIEWFNKWGPVFIFVVCNPYPFGNEQHTIFCALASILWRAQIVEGKDRPTQIILKKWKDLVKTVGIMLWMCKPIFLTRKCVVLYSGFCVSKGITALLGFGVYASALINKRKYWTKAVPGDDIDQYFSEKYVTYVDMLEAITEDCHEGKSFNIFCLK